MTIELGRAERMVRRWPVVGTGQPLEISADGGATWNALTEDEDYAAVPEVEGATWWQLWLAGPAVDTDDPDIGENPAGTLVITASCQLRGRVVAAVGGEVIEEFIEWVALVP